MKKINMQEFSYEKIPEIPLSIANLIAAVSGLISIVTGIIAIVGFLKNSADGQQTVSTEQTLIVALFLFMLLLTFKIRKYQRLAYERLKVTSKYYHKLTHEARDCFFETLMVCDEDQKSIKDLTNTYKRDVVSILNFLCQIMEMHTKEDVCACVKLVKYVEGNALEIDIRELEIKTFCRSSKTPSDRNDYEKNTTPQKLKENTIFSEIIENHNNKNYFYCTDLKKYIKELNNKNQKFSTANPAQDPYRGVIAVPIRIEREKYSNTLSDDSYYIMGFLCIDSKSKEAFPAKFEVFYSDIVKSFADILFVMFSQYKESVKIIKNRNELLTSVAGGVNDEYN